MVSSRYTTNSADSAVWYAAEGGGLAMVLGYQAADAIKAFKPVIVYPYHYQGSKVEDLPGLVGDAAEVRLRNWYQE